MRVNMKGIKRTTMRLSDGREVTYYYAWRGGPRLPGRPGDAQFIAAYNAAVAEIRPRSSDTLSKVLDAYQDSEAFRGLSPRSAKDYRDYLAKINREFGDFPLAAMTERETRGIFLAWKDKLARSSRRGADYTFAVFARALSCALDRGQINANPLEKHGKVWKGNRADNTWSPEQEAAMLAECGDPLRLAMTIALWTGQRQGDILRMTWKAYNGDVIDIRQGKGRKQVQIPVSAALRTLLDAAKRDSLYIVSHNGAPYTSDGFRSSWARAAARAGINDANLTFHDLRGTFATRAYEAGATDAEVAALTRHGTDGKDNATLRRHYLSLNLALARECIRKLESRTVLANEMANVKNTSTKDAAK